MHRPRIEAFCIGFVAGWELTAFASRGRVPTVTAVVMRLPHHPRLLLVALLWWWTVEHFGLRGTHETRPARTVA